MHAESEISDTHITYVPPPQEANVRLPAVVGEEEDVIS